MNIHDLDGFFKQRYSAPAPCTDCFGTVDDHASTCPTIVSNPPPEGSLFGIQSDTYDLWKAHAYTGALPLPFYRAMLSASEQATVEKEDDMPVSGKPCRPGSKEICGCCSTRLDAPTPTGLCRSCDHVVKPPKTVHEYDPMRNEKRGIRYSASEPATAAYVRIEPSRACESCGNIMLKHERYTCGFCKHVHSMVRKV